MKLHKTSHEKNSVRRSWMWQVLRGGSEVCAQWLGHSVPDAGTRTGEAGRAGGCREMDWRNPKGLRGAGSSE